MDEKTYQLLDPDAWEETLEILRNLVELSLEQTRLDANADEMLISPAMKYVQAQFDKSGQRHS
ncbi:hypothetical protein N9934_04115, partial [Desulfosarcina sp.]|nr:hypothetical protein [Desulfosarcina sp.]